MSASSGSCSTKHPGGSDTAHEALVLRTRQTPWKGGWTPRARRALHALLVAVAARLEEEEGGRGQKGVLLSISTRARSLFTRASPGTRVPQLPPLPGGSRESSRSSGGSAVRSLGLVGRPPWRFFPSAGDGSGRPGLLEMRRPRQAAGRDKQRAAAALAARSSTGGAAAALPVSGPAGIPPGERRAGGGGRLRVPLAGVSAATVWRAAGAGPLGLGGWGAGALCQAPVPWVGAGVRASAEAPSGEGGRRVPAAGAAAAPGVPGRQGRSLGRPGLRGRGGAGGVSVPLLEARGRASVFSGPRCGCGAEAVWAREPVLGGARAMSCPAGG